ncbi:MAG TPA: NADH-quinone oxidoreductase subunit J [Dehalococcoidia bacterium]|jgi:NADH-quinone oxidoreductase subunit J|nr:NADH-quinone oxidoreductase subunit J [Dehalococcoidia bacterium]
MSYEEVIFYFVAAAAVIGALGVVGSRNVVHSALFLIVSLIAVAGVFVLLASEFLAVVQILVYGGAVTILILFAMMLTRVRDLPREMIGKQAPVAFVAALIFMITSIVAVTTTHFPGESEKINVIDVNTIGNKLFTTYSAPFEIASLVLIVALIGAIILARGEEGE